MISVQNVSKYFGRIQALKDISFEIKKGEIIGFLGQNGAGKTTLMRILTSYLAPTAGEVFIDGKNVANNSLAIRQKIGYLPEKPPLYPNMTVKAYLKFAAVLKDVPSKEIQFQVERSMDQCRLLKVQNRMIGTLSKGYQQRIGIAQAIINEPEVLILDEPTSGLDPVQILQVRKLIQNLEYKRTVLLSTHILPEIAQIAKRVLIIKFGEILSDASMEHLLQNDARPKALLRVQGDRLAITQAIQDTDGFKQTNIQSFDDVHLIELEITGPVHDYNRLLGEVLKADGQILEMRELKSSLEDIFFKITGAS